MAVLAIQLQQEGRPAWHSFLAQFARSRCAVVRGAGYKNCPRVDLAMVTGGQGSLQCAMAAGLPAIVLPLHLEQESNVHFLEERGAVRSLPVASAGAAKLTPMVGEMLAQPRHRAAARLIQAAYAGRDGPALSAEAILNHVGARSLAA